MFAWIFTVAQIASIVACPLSCGSEQCSGSACHSSSSSAGETTTLRVNQQEKSCCCCNKMAAQEEELPPELPAKPVCQGVCGGAICAKPCELPVEATFSFLLPAAVQSSVVSWVDVRSAVGVEATHPSGNYGRSLRILHESYLC